MPAPPATARPTTPAEDRRSLSTFAALAAIGAFAVSVLAVVVVVMKAPESSAGAAASTVSVELSEFAISPSTIPASAGDITLEVTNTGTDVHDLEVVELGLQTPDLAPGESATLALGDVAPGTYTVLCTIPGHADSGMTAELAVGDESAELAADGGDGAGHADHATADDFAATEAAHDANLEAYLEAATTLGTGVPTEGTGNEPLEHTVDDDGTKVFELEASIIDWEVTPGEVVEGWAYNGQIPGPLIHVDTGDTVRVEFTNNLPFGTDVHWHGITSGFAADGLAPLTQPLVAPGKSFTYEFTVPDHPEVGMYHAHMHGNHAVPNGLFAVFQVGDVDLPRGETVSGIPIPEDLEVSQELPMVLNDAGTIGLSLNGKAYPATDPIFTEPGDTVLLHYYNEGFQEHPMHLHNIPQLVVAKDGFALDQPFWADTLNVAPGERWSVLIMPTEDDLALDTDGEVTGPGIWALHCHILSHAEGPDGLAWMVTALVVSPPED